METTGQVTISPQSNKILLEQNNILRNILRCLDNGNIPKYLIIALGDNQELILKSTDKKNQCDDDCYKLCLENNQMLVLMLEKIENINTEHRRTNVPGNIGK